MKKLRLEINSNHADRSKIAGMNIMITPIMTDDYWVYRIKLSKNQSIIGFKKFSTIGIGFSVEDKDGNTNLPASCEAEDIYNHIKKNKGDPKIRKETCIEAIRLIQKARHESLKNETISKLKESNMTDEKRLAILSIYLRQSGSHEVANIYDQEDRFWVQKSTL